MPTEQPRVEDLLDPISEDKPAGESLRWTDEWDRIKEARRSDDTLEAGEWTKKEQKSANWQLLEDLTFTALQTKTKDLQLALWFTEAGLKLREFPGLGEGFRLLKELIIRFWDRGLFPLMVDGPEDRARPLEWLNEKLVDSVCALPVTRRRDAGDDFGFAQVRAAVRIGSESSFKSKDGTVNEVKEQAYRRALADGGVSMDMYYAAVNATKLEDYDALASEVETVWNEFKGFEKAVDAKLGERAAPNLSAIRGDLREIKDEISSRLQKKRDVLAGTTGNANGSYTQAPLALPVLGPTSSINDSVSGSWQEAEQLVRTGKLDAGLSAMTRLAAGETTGRNRFQRKLLLAEVCLASRRTDLARVILEELAEQIDQFKLSDWESSDLVGGVWTRLYRLYKAEAGDQERAKELFDKLCRLDPWQALSCGD